MSKVSISGNASGSGVFTIASPSGNTDRTLTLPDATGTILTTATPGVPVNGPAFSATIGTNQSLSAATQTKLNFNTEQFDTNSNYNTSDYRFTPTVAGYYQINLAQEYSFQAGVQAATITKNGTRVSSGGSRNSISGTFFSSCSVIVYMNGSSDYVEAYGYTELASTAFSGSSSTFTGCLVRAA